MNFSYIQPTEEQIAIMQKYRELFANLYKVIDNEVENSRGKSLTLTKLEEANMWLNKALTKND